MAVHAGLARALLEAQVGGGDGIGGQCQSDHRAALGCTLDFILTGRSDTAQLRDLVLAGRCGDDTLRALVGVSASPARLGFALWLLLSRGDLGAGDLLALRPAPALLAEALLALHAAWGDGHPSAPSAFRGLVKVVATCGQPEAAAAGAAGALRQLREAWLQGGSALGQRQLQEAGWPPPAAAGGDGMLLLQRLVEAIDGDVLPRRLAASLLEAELDAVLAMPSQEAAAPAAGGLPAAMAAFAAALPPEAALARVQACTERGRDLNIAAAGELLAALSSVSSGAAAEVAAWVQASASGALLRRDGDGLRSLLLLQRRLCSAIPAGGGGGDGGGSSSSAYQRWFGALARAQEGGGEAQRGLQFLLQAVLIPMCPEEPPEVLKAHVASLAGAPQPGQLAQLVPEYSSAAWQRIRAAAAAAAAADPGKGGGAGGTAASVGPPEAALLQGTEWVAKLVRALGEGGGALPPAQVAELAAKAANPFQRGQVINCLLPALFHPVEDEAQAERRAALMEHLHAALAGPRCSLRSYFKPEAVQAYRRRCGLASLDAAPLPRLAAAAAGLLLSGPSEPEAGAGVSAAQVLGRLEQRIGRELAAAAGGAEAGSGPSVTIVGVLLGALTATVSGHLASAAAAGRRGASAGGLGGVAVELVGVMHRHPPLHAPLLARLRTLAVTAGPAGDLDPHRTMALALAAAAVGVMRQDGRAAGGGAPPVPAFVWRATTGAPPVPGPDWLAALLRALPMGTGAAAAWTCRFAAAHVSCLRHFRRFAALPAEPGAATPPAALTAPSQAPRGWEGEGAGADALVCPLPTDALQLLQWLRLRLAMSGAGPPPAQGEPGSQPAAKKARLAAATAAAAAAGGGAEDAAPPTSAELWACTEVLESPLGAILRREAGPLSLASFLRLEACAASGPPGDPPLAASSLDLRLCCGLYLPSPSPVFQGLEGLEAGLGGLVAALRGRPLTQPAAEAAGAEVQDTEEQEEDMLLLLGSTAPAGAAVQDSCGESPGLGELDRGRGPPGWRLDSSAVAREAGEAAGAALAQLTAEASERSWSPAALHACSAHLLRCLAGGDGGALPELLGTFVEGALAGSWRGSALCCPPARAAAAGGGGAQRQQLLQPAQGQLAALAAAAATLASGLWVDLVLPSSSAGSLEAAQARVALLARAVRRALAPPAPGPAERTALLHAFRHL